AVRTIRAIVSPSRSYRERSWAGSSDHQHPFRCGGGRTLSSVAVVAHFDADEIRVSGTRPAIFDHLYVCGDFRRSNGHWWWPQVAWLDERRRNCVSQTTQRER